MLAGLQLWLTQKHLIDPQRYIGTNSLDQKYPSPSYSWSRDTSERTRVLGCWRRWEDERRNMRREDAESCDRSLARLIDEEGLRERLDIHAVYPQHRTRRWQKEKARRRKKLATHLPRNIPPLSLLRTSSGNTPRRSPPLRFPLLPFPLLNPLLSHISREQTRPPNSRPRRILPRSRLNLILGPIPPITG